MKKISVIFLFIGVLIMSPMTGFADEITIVADSWCPYNCEPDAESTGFMVEIAKKVFNKAGHTVRYEIVEWDEALAATREGKYNAVTGAAKTDAEGFIFPENELGMVANHFFVRKDFAWEYAGIDSLKGVRVGIIQGYEYEDELDEYFADSQDKQNIYVASGENPLEDLIGKLVNGDIDVVIEDGLVFSYFFVSHGIIDMFGQCRNAGPTGEPDQLYIAFSPANSKSEEYARVLSEGVAALRKSGEIDKILANYGSKDWK